MAPNEEDEAPAGMQATPPVDAEEPPVAFDDDGRGRVVFRRALLRQFGTVWETRAVNQSPHEGVHFSYYNNSKNANNSNILQVILRDHGFHKTEPPDNEWNVFWCAGQARRCAWHAVC